MVRKRLWMKCLGICLVMGLAIEPAAAQMVSGTKIPGFNETFGLKGERTPAITVEFIESSAPANVLWPQEQASFRFQVANRTDQAVQIQAKVRLIAYATKGRAGDIWIPDMFAVEEAGVTPVEVKIAAKGFANVTVSPAIPQRFGAYGLVLDMGEHGRQFITSCIRTFKADAKPVQFPQFCLDNDDPALLVRLGAAPNRMGIPYKPTTDPDFAAWYQKKADELVAYKKAGLAIMVEIGGGDPDHVNQPLGRARPHLDEKGLMRDTKSDMAWLPSSDPDFKVFCKKFASEFGWPKGPINAMKVWNEPWEGISISGWGADVLRYREIFTALCLGVEEARKEAGVQVLLGGCDSSSNTFDKLFSDGSQDMLKWLDFCSIHYQGMAPPATVKAWVNRQGPNGRVKIWDTESWVANTDDRVAAVVATNLSTGHDRAVGIYYGNIASEWTSRRVQIKGDDGRPLNIQRSHTWSVAASVAATTHFIGERKFQQLLFTNGLPWVSVFNGRIGADADAKADPEDGTVVVVGDIGDEFGHDWLLFRNARGFAEIQHKQALRQQLAALPADAPATQRATLETAIAKPETLSGATMTLSDPDGKMSLYDFYGNPVPAQQGKIVVPLDHRGFFLRGNGQAGSFAKLLQAMKTADIQGIEPLAKACHDLTAPVDQGAVLRLSLTNVLNRPITGNLAVTLGQLQLQPASQEITFKPNQTREVEVRVSGKPTADNNYPLALTFDGGRDGRSTHQEDMHVNYIARRTIKVDGNLDDWRDVVPQIIRLSGPSGPTLAEKAWLPFEKFAPTLTHGLATAYLAYDNDYFYFAAKIADDTPDAGMPRFETRNDDDYFYPELSYKEDPAKTTTRREVDAPAGAPSSKLWEPKAQRMELDLDLPGERMVSLALFDQDSLERRVVRYTATDRLSGKKVASAEVKQAGPGVWTRLRLSGKVRISIESSMWLRASLAAVAVDPLPANSPAGAVLPEDRTTGGKFDGVYGRELLLLPGQPDRGSVIAKWNEIETKAEYRWPEGVRRYSYRMRPELPAGNAPNHDNVQIAFNVVPADQKDWNPCPPGTMPGYIAYSDTDYEYALNPVGEQYGGGVEIWRLTVPGMPRKHFYPRQPKSPLDGAVKDGKLVIKREANMRIVEAAIPWSELPLVRKAMDQGQTIKFSYRVNDNAGIGCMELSRGRSVAKRNGSFHADWVEHWANELEFGFKK